MKIDVNDKTTIKKLNGLIDVVHESYMDKIKNIQTQFSVSKKCANNISYLRISGRWTQEAENELIRMDKEDHSQPNILEWP